VPVDPKTGKRYPYTKEGRAAFERDQRKRKRGRRRRRRLPSEKLDEAPANRGGLMDIIEEAKRKGKRGRR
jgi:hypothetical protein